MAYIPSDWDTCVRLLGHALSRYNGLTNSAQLVYITQLISADANKKNGNLFDDRPFLYAREIIPEFEKNMKPRSAEVLLQHAVLFGFLYRAVSGTKSKHPNLTNKVESRSHIALSPLGRAIRSSECLGDKKDKFQLFLWEYALLERDFDMYGLMIKMTAENGGKMVDKTKFFTKFEDIRKQQISWMNKTIPHVVRREQIQRNISWIGKKSRKRQFKLDEVFEFSENSKKHHYSQRIRWAKNFKHVSNDKLTELGILLAKNLPGTDNEPFFWLGPPIECAKSRWLSATNIPERQCSPAWNLLRHREREGEGEPSEAFVREVTGYMENAFDLIRLTNFKQSSLDIVVPYIHFLERQSGEIVNEKKVFQMVLDSAREKFVCTLRANLAKSHYHIRGA